MTLAELNALPQEALAGHFQQCCAAERWYKNLAARAPFASLEALLAAADDCWALCGEADFLEAFAAHPKIGDVESLAKKYQATKAWAGNEQSLVADADMAVIRTLAIGNEKYLARFGFIFIVFATGKTAKEMLNLLVTRFSNERPEELLVAAAEQHKITRLRLHKLLDMA